MDLVHLTVTKKWCQFKLFIQLFNFLIVSSGLNVFSDRRATTSGGKGGHNSITREWGEFLNLTNDLFLLSIFRASIHFVHTLLSIFLKVIK